MDLPRNRPSQGAIRTLLPRQASHHNPTTQAVSPQNICPKILGTTPLKLIKLRKFRLSLGLALRQGRRACSMLNAQVMCVCV